MCVMRVALCVGAVLASFAAAQPTPTASKPEPGYFDPQGRFALDPPRAWRALTPDEARTLRASSGGKIPTDLLDPQPPRVVVFGAIDRWLAGAFDGQALSIVLLDGEPELDEGGLASIRTHFQQLSSRGVEKYALENLTIASVGSGKHPAALATLAISGGGAGARLRFDAYVPTGGDTLSVALTTPSADRVAAEAMFRAVSDSLRVGAPARGANKLGGKLFWAALLGVLIGVALHQIKRRTRR